MNVGTVGIVGPRVMIDSIEIELIECCVTSPKIVRSLNIAKTETSIISADNVS